MTERQSPDRDGFAPEPRSIDLRDYWLIVRRRWVLVLVLTVIGAIGGAGYSFAAGPTYSATSQGVVLPMTQGPLNPPTQPNSQVNMSTEQAFAQSPLVAAQAARLLHVQPAVLQQEAAKRLTVSVPANTITTSDDLQITWKAATAAAAQAGANAFARAYLSSRHQELASQIASLRAALTAQTAALQKQIARLTGQLNSTSSGSSIHQNQSIRLDELTAEATTAQSQLGSLPTYNDSGGTFIGAALPLSPSGLTSKIIIIVGGLLGLLIGLALVFVRDAFDDRVRDAAQLERGLGAPTLAVLTGTGSLDRETREGRRGTRRSIATAASPQSRDAETVRALRATLVALAARHSLGTLLVACPDAASPVGTVTANLGIALAESGRNVLLVGSDLRDSSLADIFDLPNSSGLSDVLAEDGDVKVLTRAARRAGGSPLPGAIARRLSVLPSGPLMPHALTILDSGSMLGLLQSQREDYDFVILDSPPASVASDVFALAAHVDGVLVLAREARTMGRAVADLRRGLDHVGAQVLGGVLLAKGGGSHRRAAPASPVSPGEGRRPGSRSVTHTRSVPPATGDDASESAGSLAKRPL